ncbi:MAG: Fe-S cluster assembly sulfur transfer protein SufU [Gemmatimonas sp.]
MLSALYQDALLAHYRSPQNRREMAEATGTGSRRNPLCGDEVQVQLRVENGMIVDVAFSGRACSIATASASMLTEVVRGLTPRGALDVADALDRMLRGECTALTATLQALRGVAPFPARHACATMPWAAFRAALSPELAPSGSNSG